MKSAVRSFLILGLLAAGSAFAYAQHDHSQMAGQPGAAPSAKDAGEIFCPTMKTGQLCSHGTSAIFGFTGQKQQDWEALSHRYNKAVDAATVQLLKDAENVLTPDQLDLLKSWFAVGLNPEINKLLNSKGLGAQKP